ncbi:unnamed protein product, partial [Ixodes pacificus]
VRPITPHSSPFSGALRHSCIEAWKALRQNPLLPEICSFVIQAHPVAGHVSEPVNNRSCCNQHSVTALLDIVTHDVRRRVRQALGVPPLETRATPSLTETDVSFRLRSRCPRGSLRTGRAPATWIPCRRSGTCSTTAGSPTPPTPPSRR